MIRATTIQETEGVPSAYPPTGLTPEPANASICWARIESYIAHRWAPRTVLWVVEGPGEWVPPLAPATIVSASIWRVMDYETIELDASPLGGLALPAVGPYNILATVGEDGADVPAAVLEAVHRLSDFLSAAAHRPGVRAVAAGQVSARYDESAFAMAMQRSGAADLLRPFRRVA